jgi:hypothetical protein
MTLEESGGRYTDVVEVKPAVELRPGDQITTVRTVTQVLHTAKRIEVTYDDGTVQSFDLAGDPAIEVVATP